MDNVSGKLKKELVYLGIMLVGGIIIFQFLFFKENVITTARAVLSLFWLFVIPGFAVMYCWQDKLEFSERVVIGTVLGIAMMGITSYYIGLAGIHVKFHFLLPAIIIAIAVFFMMRKKGENIK